MRRWLAVLWLILVTCAPARAWDDVGHRLTGELAYDRLAALDPPAVAAIERIMAAHPDRARFDRSLGDATGGERARRLFGLMARWPDDTRGTAWDRPEWHYALVVAHGWTWLDFYTAGEAYTQWQANLATVRDAAAAPAERAVALCWLFHITGDMHQPLHRGHRLDWRWPRSDRAGTIAWVRRAAGGPALSLHELWDQGVTDAPTPKGAAQGAMVARLHDALRPTMRPTMRPEPALVPGDRVAQSRFEFAGWMEESRRLAQRTAYSGPALDAAPAKADAPAMTPGYLQAVRSVSTRRVVQAGSRLGQLLQGLR